MKIALKSLAFISVLLFSLLMANAQNDTLKVFILAGQSNMAGYGQIEGVNTIGTLEHTVANDTEGEFALLTDDNGEFVVREDVWVRYNHEFGELDKGPLGIGFGAYSEFIGPEYGFGFQLGEHLDEPILLIKTAWGGKSLAVDFRPPSSGGTTGPYYLKILEEVNTCLENLADEFPAYDGMPYKIAGFAWHQGWNDGETSDYWEEYESNMVNFINDIRNDLNTPNLPFVIANTGIGGFEPSTDGWTNDLQTYVAPAQEMAAMHPDFEGNVLLADTRPFWREADESPDDQLHHWHTNAWTYYMIGNELGIKMIELLPAPIINDVEGLNNKKIQYYPNPVLDQINIDGAMKDWTIELYSLKGQLLHSELVKKELSTINISKFETGNYILKIKDSKVKFIESYSFFKQ